MLFPEQKNIDAYSSPVLRQFSKNKDDYYRSSVHWVCILHHYINRSSTLYIHRAVSELTSEHSESWSSYVTAALKGLHIKLLAQNKPLLRIHQPALIKCYQSTANAAP